MLAALWVAQFTVDDGLELRGCLDFADNLDGFGVADFTGGDRVCRAHSVHQETLPGLRAETLRAGTGLHLGEPDFV